MIVSLGTLLSPTLMGLRLVVVVVVVVDEKRQNVR